jgi:hypothetical protein
MLRDFLHEGLVVELMDKIYFPIIRGDLEYER